MRNNDVTIKKLPLVRVDVPWCYGGLSESADEGFGHTVAGCL